MKRFKIIFYSTYLTLAGIGIFFSIFIMRDLKGFTQEYLHIKNLSFITNTLPYYILSYLLLISLIMVVEFGYELIQMNQWKKRAHQAEEEVLKLKARLYDQKSSEEEPEDDPEDSSDDEDENESREGQNED